VLRIAARSVNFTHFMTKLTPTFESSRRAARVSCFGMLLLVTLVARAEMPGDIAAIGPRTISVDLSAYAAVYYVAPGASHDAVGDGTQAKPWPSVALAMQRVEPVATGHRIAVLVAAGTYDDATVQMRGGVDLFGGYSAGSWQRDIFKNATILDGRHVRRVVLGASDARLDGFIVRRGRAFGDGGAILCDGSSPTISNNRIEDSFTLEPEDFRADRIHQEGHRGGAVACLFDSVPLITNNLFIDNWTEIGDGGALAVYGRSEAREHPGMPRARIENNVFVDNRAGVREDGRTRSSSGGAVVFSHENSPVFRNNIVAHNRSLGNSDAGGIYNEFICSPTIENNWIVGNEADDDGGGIYTMRMGEPVIRHNLFAGNGTANGGVGGVRISKEGRAQVVDNQIVRNRTGGGILDVDGYLIAQGNLIADNLDPSRQSAGISLRQSFAYFQPSRIENNRILRNQGGAILVQKKDVGPPPVLAGNTIQEGPPATDSTTAAITAATFDQSRGQTVIQLKGALGDIGTLAGRIVWRGDYWSVVVTNQADTITVWGNLAASDSDPALHLMPEYPGL